MPFQVHFAAVNRGLGKAARFEKARGPQPFVQAYFAGLVGGGAQR